MNINELIVSLSKELFPKIKNVVRKVFFPKPNDALDIAKDARQEASLHTFLWLKDESKPNKANPKGYYMRVARNKVVDVAKYRGRYQVGSEENEASLENYAGELKLAEESIAEGEMRFDAAEMIKALQTLNDKERLMLEHQYFIGGKLTELVASGEITEQEAQRGCGRFLKKLAKLLTGDSKQ